MPPPLSEHLGAGIIGAISLCFVGVHSFHFLRESETVLVLLAWTVTPLLVSVVLVGLAYWLVTIRMPRSYQLRVTGWFLIGTVTITGFGTLIVLNQQSMGQGLTDPLYTLVNSATGGAAVGSITGLYDVRGKRRDDRLVELHTSTQLLLESGSKKEAATIAVETLSALLDLEISAVWLFEDGKLAPVATTAAAKAAFDEIPVFEPGTSLAWSVYETQEERLFTNVQDNPDRYNTETPVSMELMIPLGHHGVMVCGSFRNRTIQAYQRELSHILATHTKLVFDRLEQTTDLEEREDELQRQNERLEKFASVVSHDLQNPLSIISGYLELAREHPTEAHFDEIEQAADRMQLLIEDLLALARTGDRVRNVESVDLGTVAEEAWSNVPSASVSLHVDAGAGSIEADPSRLRQLLENLFRNSIEHGGDVRQITVHRERNGFAVTDDGSGIPERERSNVFEFGYSNSTAGSGLGLAIVREIVEGHGWTIEIGESAPGGARFEITTAGSVDARPRDADE